MERKFFLILLLLALSLQSANIYAQDLGQPYIKNYSTTDYQAGSQNWSAIQDSRGVMFIGNSAGVLEFDGTSWRTILTSNRSAVRSLAKDDQDQIYVGCKGDFGILEADSIGMLNFKSLLHLVDSSFKDFNDVWDINITSERVYFSTFKYVFSWDGKTMDIIFPRSTFHLTYKVRNQIYVKDRKHGVFRIDGNELIPTALTQDVFPDLLHVMLPWEKDEFLLGSRTGGLVIFDGKSIRKFKTEVDEELKIAQIYCAIELIDKTIAVGTLNGGIFILDKEGNLKMKIDKRSGMQDNVVTNFFLDQQSGLWITLNDGVSRLETASPFTFFEASSGVEGIITSITRYDDRLYLGTTQGLQVNEKWSKSYNSEPVSTVSSFKLIDGIDTEVWHLLSIKKSLLLATSAGVYDFREAKNRFLGKGVCFFLHQSKKDPNRLYAAFYQGVRTFYYRNNKWEFEKEIDGIHEEIRTIAEVVPGEIWFGTAQIGAIKLNENDNLKVEKFDSKNGLPVGYVHVSPINGQIKYATFDGIFYYDNEKKFFKKDSSFGSDITQVSLLHQSDNSTGITLIYTDENISRIKRGFLDSNKQYIYNDNVFIRIPQMSIFGFHTDKNNVTWLGGRGGLIRFDGNVKRTNENNYKALVRRVFINEDSLIYGGANFDNQLLPKLKYVENNILFEFAATSHDASERNQFKFILDGFDKKWSDWTKLDRKEYTNIPEGNYVFKIIAKNAYNQESQVASFQFEISPPWYRSFIAYVLYGLLLTAFVVMVTRLNAMRLRRMNEELELLVKTRTMEITEKNSLLEEQKLEIIKQKEELMVAAEGLKKANDEISYHNVNLESLIAERTAELEYKNKKLSDYAYTNSHELRAPVANLLGLVNLFDKKRSPEEMKEYIDMLKKVAVRMDEITYEIRDRLESEGHNIDK